LTLRTPTPLQGAEELIAIVRELAADGDPIQIATLFKVRVDRRRRGLDSTGQPRAGAQ